MTNKHHQFPLSLSQLNIWNLERSLQNTPVNNICATIRIEGRVDFVLMQKSIQTVLQNDSNLRTRIVEAADGTVNQYHADYAEEEFPLYDLSHTSEEGIKSWEEAMTREPIPVLGGRLYRFILFRAGENEGGILVKTHHIISDGWSEVLICNRITKVYLEFLEGKTPNNSQVPEFELHINEENEYLRSKSYQKDKRYWTEILSKINNPSLLKNVKSAVVSPVGKRFSAELPQILNHAIFSFCKEKRVAPFAVYYIALAIFFRRVGDSDQFTIGVPILNRPTFEAKQGTGMFVTTLPFFNEINEEWSFNQFNEVLMESWLEMLKHQRFPFSHIEKLKKESSSNEERLFNIALSYQDSQMVESTDTSVTVSGRWHYSGYQSEQLCIHITNLKDQKCYSVDYDYLTQFFTEEEIRRLHDTVCNILIDGLTNPDRPLNQLSILSMEEKEQVLYSFNRTDKTISCECAFEAFERIVKKHGQRVAAIFHNQKITYSSLLDKACNIDRQLPVRGKEDSVVALLFPRGMEILESMVAALRGGRAFVCISPDLPTERITNILKDSNACTVVTDCRTAIKCGIDEQLLPVVYTDKLKEVPMTEPVYAQADDLAYIVYTSGSTGKPKGVEITQKNIVNYAEAMKSVYGKDGVLSICNVGFDAFMIESIVPLMNGKTVIISDSEEQESPKRIAQLIKNYAAGFMALTPSRLDAYLRDTDFCLALRQMEAVMCGGESFSGNTLRKLKNITCAKIYNQYGPSETTVGVCQKEMSSANIISAGKPMQNCRLYVLDSWHNPLPAGVTGNLYISGLCVGRGYRNRPDLTDEVFMDNPFETGERMYFTGDLALWTSEGEIIITGRTDNQVKLRGLRVEPEEVAACIASHPCILAAAAKVWEIKGQQVLVAYYSSSEDVSETELLSFAATYLPQYMIPSIVMRMDKIPVSVNGKTDFSLLPEPEMNDSTVQNLQGVSDVMLNRVVMIFSEVLNNMKVNATSDYFLSGGNSLNAMETIARIEDETGLKVRIADLYVCRNAVKLTRLLQELSGEKNFVKEKHVMKKAPGHNDYEMSHFQQGIYVQSYLDATGIAYNMPGAFRLSEKPDLEKLEKAFRILIEDDDIFRTSFIHDGGTIYCHVKKMEEAEFHIEYLRGETLEEAEKQFLRPFDLSEAPLLRAGIFKNRDEVFYLLIDSHHIIGDGMSTSIVLERLNDIYSGRRTNVNYTYRDYLYTIGGSENSVNTADRIYWENNLKNIPEQLRLPADYSIRKEFDFKGKEIVIRFDGRLTSYCDEFCSNNSISSFMLFIGAFGILISRISGKEDFLIGTPVAGRTITETRKICGPFISTLPVRLRPAKGRTVNDYFSEIRDEINGIIDHQSFSLEELISLLNLPRSEQNPLYQILFSQSPVDEGNFKLGDMPMKYIEIPTGTVKMDLTVESTRIEDEYAFRINYAAGLFMDETIRFYGRCLKQIVKQIISGSKDFISDIDTLCASDTEQLIEEPMFTTVPFVNLPIHKLIKKKMHNSLEESAVIFHNQTVSRDELERRACGMACILKEAGVRNGQCIGLGFSRTPDMLAGLYAVLKCGCAYMPVLPHFPKERLSYMIETAKTEFMFCDSVTADALPEGLNCSIITASERYEENFDDEYTDDDSLAHVLFTSGSTGRPKGVMVKHRAISNLLVNIKEIISVTDRPMLCSTNDVFDTFITESLMSLAAGKTVVLADEEEMMLPWKLAELITKNHVGCMQMTPTRFQMCLGNEAFLTAVKELELIILSGEVLSERLAEKIRHATDARIVNMYGPTEATVYITYADVTEKEHIVIGKPVNNSRIYILDDEMKPVMPTACGEIYMAGECIAKGYISKPELTDKVFVPDPFVPGGIMYKSGDQGRLRIDGNYDFLGRRDSQIKLNGQRVELEEITATIMESGEALQAATAAVTKEDGSMELCAFYEPESSDSGCREIVMENMKKKLPAYMIPSRLLAVDQIPLTASGKTDMQCLKKMAAEGLSHVKTAETVKEESVKLPEKEPKTTGGVEYILEIWKQILTQKDVNPDKSFFEQGGTSLDALGVLSLYFNDGREMSLAQFYENPTALMQVQVLGIAEPKVQAEMEEETSVNTSAEKNSILVTGGTGFLGSHLINTLLKNTEAQIICIMRDGSRERLIDTLDWYFGGCFGDRFSDRIEVVRGDISKQYFGMESDDYDALSSKISCIYHSAADVRHYAADQTRFLNTNIEGTDNVISMAMKSNVELYHMSTCSISGDSLKESSKTAEFTEDDFDIGQIWENNIYLKSKFIAEQHIYEAIEHGLKAKVFRLGRLVGRSTDGMFQKNPETNAFYLLMKAICVAGVIPEAIADAPIDLTPVDYAAETIFLLTKDSGTVFHIMNYEPNTVRQVVKETNPGITVIDNDQFTLTLMEKTRKGYASQLSVLIDYWYQVRNNPHTVSLSGVKTYEKLKNMNYDFRKPKPGVLLEYFPTFNPGTEGRR